MAGKVKHADLGSMTARAKLKKGRQPHWEEIQTNIHLGYQRQTRQAGRWILRRYVVGSGNKYRVTALGIADDINEADGVRILNHNQAKAMANAMVETPNTGKVHNLTVKLAYERYVKRKESEGQEVGDVISRANVHILPTLGNLVVSELTDDTLRQWLSTLARSHAQRKSHDSKPRYAPKAETDEEIRKRRASANRVLTMLKAILNLAFDDKQVSNRDAWGRRLKPFKDVEAATPWYLEIPEAKRLINSSEPDFRLLVRAALETGARYSELARLEVTDFNSDSGTVAIRKSKTSKSRHIILNDEGAAFFKSQTVGRSPSERMFTRSDGTPWRKSNQGDPMREALKRASIDKPITFHGMRHTWASHAVMNGVPLMIVAKNLGHKDTKQVEKTYGHLAPSFVVDAIRAGAPKYGFETDTKVVPLR